MRSPSIRAACALAVGLALSIGITYLAAYTVRHLADGLPEPFFSIFAQLSDAQCVPSVPVGLCFLVLGCTLGYRVWSGAKAARIVCGLLFLPLWYAAVFVTMRVNAIPLYTAMDVVVRIVNSGIL